MELSPIATLCLVEYLLSRHDQYARGCEATDGHGEPVDPTDPNARAWSIDGAIHRVTNAHISDRINSRVKEIVLRVGINRGYHSIAEMRHIQYRRAANIIREAVVVAKGH